MNGQNQCIIAHCTYKNDTYSKMVYKRPYSKC